MSEGGGEGTGRAGLPVHTGFARKSAPHLELSQESSTDHSAPSSSSFHQTEGKKGHNENLTSNFLQEQYFFWGKIRDNGKCKLNLDACNIEDVHVSF